MVASMTLDMAMVDFDCIFLENLKYEGIYQNSSNLFSLQLSSSVWTGLFDFLWIIWV